MPCKLRAGFLFLYRLYYSVNTDLLLNYGRQADYIEVQKNEPR